MRLSSTVSILRPERALVLGVGNLLWADEGFGVRCVESFAQRYHESDFLEILDGGTQGMALVPKVAAATQLLLFDTVDAGLTPGSLTVARDGEVPGYLGSDKMSLHQAGVADILACVELMGKAPDHITLIGVQPVELEDYGGSLTAPVRAQLEPAIELAVAELTHWNVALQSRGNLFAAAADPLALSRYERERPNADLACRIGDARVLARARSGA